MPNGRLDVHVANLDCEHDAAAIERGLRHARGVTSVKVALATATVSVEYDAEQTQPEDLRATLARLGFAAQRGMEIAEQPRPWRNPRVLASVASGVLFAIGWLLSSQAHLAVAPVAVFLVSIVVGGYYFGREALETLVFERQIGTELLMSVAAIVAFIMGEAAEGAMLVFLYSISEAMEGYTEEKTRSAINTLMKLTPKTALVRRNGSEREMPIEEVAVGDIFIVRPGEAIATDGLVVAGRSSVNQSPVTGESMPVEKGEGDVVFAGSINGEGSLEVRATNTYSDNTIARIIQMVAEAQERKGKSQRFIERFGARYSPSVLALGLLIAVIPPLLLGAPWPTWITRATVFIVAAAPCALVISIPVTIVASLGTAARQGVLIKGGVYLEELAHIRVVALDKTGTLTYGEPEVSDVLLCVDRPAALVPSETALLSIAASIEQRSEHPLARAIVRHAQRAGAATQSISDFRALPGAGASAVVNGIPVTIGSPEAVIGQAGDHPCAQEVIEHLRTEGKTVVVVGSDTAIWGLLAVKDRVRPNARQAVAELRAAGVDEVVMLTGDNVRTAQTVAVEAGIESIYADLTPQDKVAQVERLAALHGHVAMVGDGVNDAPALAAATVGVTLGAAGTDVALETANVALMADNLQKLAYALRLARRSQAIIGQNLVLSALVIGTLMVGAVAGVLTLPLAVLGHEISEWFVIANGLRMLRG